jgi:hypothetical protein
MEKITAFECSNCPRPKIYRTAKQAKAHEKKCFYNPETKSCATCLWFSPLIVEFGFPTQCYLGKIKEVPEGSKMKLNTKCKKWMNHEIYFDHETSENQDEMEEKLVSGEVDYFKTLQKS